MGVRATLRGARGQALWPGLVILRLAGVQGQAWRAWRGHRARCRGQSNLFKGTSSGNMMVAYRVQGRCTGLVGGQDIYSAGIRWGRQGVGSVHHHGDRLWHYPP